MPLKTEIKKLSIKKLIPNSSNPRFIRDDKFEKLVRSVKDFPEMLDIRPIVINKENIILGGNMRYNACLEAGLKEVPTITVDLTEAQQKEFIIKDNTSGGQWNWDILGNEWSTTDLEEWGMDVWQAEEVADYSILDNDDLGSDLEDMKNGVKRAIQIPFDLEHYDEAFELVKFWREKGGYVGMMLIEKLKQEKE